MYRLSTITKQNKRSKMKCELKRSILKLTPTNSDQPMVNSCDVLTGI